MRIAVSKLTLYFFSVLMFLYPVTAQGASTAKVECGDYSFMLPEHFSINYVEEDSGIYKKDLILPLLLGKNDSPAVITCMLEKKTSYYDFVLFRKQKIKIQGSGLPHEELAITATENTMRGTIPLKYNILEEKIVNNREVRGMYYYIPVLEIGNIDDNQHTMIFVNDFRKDGEFFDMEEYKSSVNKTTAAILRSIKRKMP